MQLQNRFTLTYLRPILSYLQAEVKPLVQDIQAFFMKEGNDTFPKFATICVSTLCTAKCGFCAYRLLKDKPQIMPFETCKKAIDEFAKNGVKVICFTPTIGEALTDSDLFNKIKYAKSKGMYVVFDSNGTLLKNNDNYKKIIESKIDEFRISLADVNPKYESKVYRISEDIAKHKMEGILLLVKEKAAKKSKLKIYLQFRAMRPYSKIYPVLLKSELGKYTKYFNVEYNHSYDNWGGKITQKDLLGVQRFMRIPKNKKLTCGRIHNLTILPNGDVRLCGCRVKDTLYDELIVGNIHKNTLLDLFKSKKRKELLGSFAKGKLPDVCKDCSHYVPSLDQTKGRA